MHDSILYYPTIEITNGDWLKCSLLLWDSVYRIVPKSYEPQDSSDTKAAVDCGLVRSINLEDNDIRGLTNKFQSFCENLEFIPAGLEDNYDISNLHEEKIDSHLYPVLERYAVGKSEGGFIQLPSYIARGYMFFLSTQVARRRGLARCTDDKYSHAVSAFFSEEGNFSENIYDREAAGYYSSLIINDLLPRNISSIPMQTIIRAIEKSKDERLEFRESLMRISRELYRCESDDHANVIYSDYAHDLMRAKKRLTDAQELSRLEDLSGLFVVGVPTTLTALGTFAAINLNPFSLKTVVPSLVIGAVAAYLNYPKVKPVHKGKHGASYLISLEKEFLSTNTYPAFDRYFEEFIND